MSRLSRTVPALAALVVALTACPKKPATTPQPAAVNADSVAREQARRDSIAAAERARADALAAAQRAAADSAARAQRAAQTVTGTDAATLATPVYFDYDRAELGSEARAVLDAKVAILTARGGATLRITGHTDNRGSDEYNLALGLRRASAVKRYLTQHGIADSRLEAVSMGEEQPVADGDDDASRARNRRAEFAAAGDGGAP